MADTNNRPSFSEGDASVRITWVDYQMSRGGNPMLAFKLEGTDGDSKGARTTHRIPLIGKMMWRFYNFCRAAGVNAKDAFLARTNPEVLLEIFVGKEVIATFESSKYKDKDGINRVGYDVATTKPVDLEAQAVAAFTAADFPTGDALVEITWVDLVESSTGKPMLNFKLVSSIGPKAGAEHTYRAVLTDSSVWKHDDLATAVGITPPRPSPRATTPTPCSRPGSARSSRSSARSPPTRTATATSARAWTSWPSRASTRRSASAWSSPARPA